MSRERFDYRNYTYRDRDDRDRYHSRDQGSRAPPMRRGDRFHDSQAKAQSSTLFVGGIPYDFNERDLEELFDRYGRVEKAVIGMDRSTGRPKGYGFVIYEDRRDAEDAYERLQGYELAGRKLRLDFDVGLQEKQRKISQWEGRRLDRQGRRRSRSRSRSAAGSRSPPRRRNYSRTPSPPPRASSRHSRTPSPPPRASSRHSRTPSPPPRASSRHSRTPSPRPRASSRHSRTPSPRGPTPRYTSRSRSPR